MIAFKKKSAFFPCIQSLVIFRYLCLFFFVFFCPFLRVHVAFFSRLTGALSPGKREVGISPFARKPREAPGTFPAGVAARSPQCAGRAGPHPAAVHGPRPADADAAAAPARAAGRRGRRRPRPATRGLSPSRPPQAGHSASWSFVAGDLQGEGADFGLTLDFF